MHPRTPLVLSLLAFLLALASGAYAWHTQFRTVPALVAARDLPAGHPLAETDLEVRRVPAGGRPDGALEAAAQTEGRYTALPLLQGQMLTGRHLTGAPPAKGMAEQVGSGQRVVSIAVKPEHVLGGALTGGDLVDVIVAYPPAEEKLPVRVDTLLSGVRVMDTRNQAGLSTGEKAEYGGPGAVPHSVLLLVTPSEAQRLIGAAQTKDATIYLLLAGREKG